jgi:serine/threonine protein kinase
MDGRAGMQGLDVSHRTGFGCRNEQGRYENVGLRVEHRDIRPPNMLWNPEIRNAMLVDFERSKILEQVPVFQETSPNRRRKHFHFDPFCASPTGFLSIQANASIELIHTVGSLQ